MPHLYLIGGICSFLFGIYFFRRARIHRTKYRLAGGTALILSSTLFLLAFDGHRNRLEHRVRQIKLSGNLGKAGTWKLSESEASRLRKLGKSIPVGASLEHVAATMGAPDATITRDRTEFYTGPQPVFVYFLSWGPWKTVGNPELVFLFKEDGTLYAMLEKGFNPAPSSKPALGPRPQKGPIKL